SESVQISVVFLFLFSRVKWKRIEFGLKFFSMQETIQRYQRRIKEVQIDKTLVEQNMQYLKHEAADMSKKIEHLENAKRKLLGEGLGSCTFDELLQIEQQLEKSASTIRARKMQVFREQIEKLKEKERALAAENAMLYEKDKANPEKSSFHHYHTRENLTFYIFSMACIHSKNQMKKERMISNPQKVTRIRMSKLNYSSDPPRGEPSEFHPSDWAGNPAQLSLCEFAKTYIYAYL
ncbi:hypothetical protein C3L33_08039, partial [Rhododendron williamsianum]